MSLTGKSWIFGISRLAESLLSLSGGRCAARWLAVPLLTILSCDVALASDVHRTRQAWRSVRDSLSAGSEDPRGCAAIPGWAQPAVSATFGREDPAYHARPFSEGWRAANERHRFRVDFSGGGLTVDSDEDQVAVGLRAIGYGDALVPVQDVSPSAERNRVEYRRERLVE
jgi:hypothetical protein